jgi:hypothetical protein
MHQNELPRLDKNDIKELTLLDNQKVKKRSRMVAPLDLVSFALYCPNKLVSFHNFHSSEIASLDARTTIFKTVANIGYSMQLSMLVLPFKLPS